jgi:type I restriction enzyme M protein
MKTLEEEAGRQQQSAILHMLGGLPDALFKDRAEFEKILNQAARKAKVKLSSSLRKAILAALSERDETAEMCRDKDGHPEPDTELRDTEDVPLRQDVTEYFEREVKPHVPDAWINTGVRDHKDGEVGRVGYEINFNRYFYQYQPPRPLEEIETDIRTLEQEIMEMLHEVTQ